MTPEEFNTLKLDDPVIIRGLEYKIKEIGSYKSSYDQTEVKAVKLHNYPHNEFVGLQYLTLKT